MDEVRGRLVGVTDAVAPPALPHTRGLCNPGPRVYGLGRPSFLTTLLPTHYWRVSPRCPRTAINSQRSPPAATREHEASAGIEPDEQRTRTRS